VLASLYEHRPKIMSALLICLAIMIGAWIVIW
jgi:hypothetical protein